MDDLDRDGVLWLIDHLAQRIDKLDRIVTRLEGLVVFWMFGVIAVVIAAVVL